MSTPLPRPRSWRLSSWVNEISPTNWKVVITGYMQTIAVVVFFLGWIIDIIGSIVRKLPTDFHETSLGIMFGFLAGLSGFTLYGRIQERKTDYGYVERVNAGKAIDATAPPPAPQVIAGDGAQINATQPAAGVVVPAQLAPAPAAKRASVVVGVLPDDDDDDGVM